MKPFSLLVKPASADCNLRCQYCFYLDHAALYPDSRVHRMDDDTLERMISSFMAVPMPQHAFGWQGGEPTLMGVEFFRRATQLQQQHGREGAVVANGLQTNATLITDEFARHLAEYRFLVGVSLDGPAEIHDHYRLAINGTGSHADVLRGIGRLQEQGVEFNILVLVNDHNVTQARRVYEYLGERGYFFQQYIPCVEFGPDAAQLPFTITGRQWGDFLCELYDTWIAHDTRKVSIRLFDSIIAYLVDGARTVCNMGHNCCQYFVVEHNGDIYPCDFFVESDLRIGNIADMSWQEAADSGVYRNFGARKAAWNEACDTCPHLTICAGECLKHRMYGGNAPRNLSWLCAGWKQFYDHAMPGMRRLAEEVKAERAQAQAQAQAQARMQRPAPPSPAPDAQPGRNDPCPCGSGKKYKRCCMGKLG